MKDQQMESPLVSIIVPTFNSGITISRCLESILAQKFQNFEILVMDGLSGDDTQEIVKSYGGRDKRVRAYFEKDDGIYHAINKAIPKSSGEWIYILGSDDYLFDDMVLEDVFLNIELLNHDFVYGNVFSMDYGENYDGEFDMAKIQNRNICHQAIFVRKSILLRYGMFKTKYPLQADYDFNLRCMFSNEIRKKHINRTIAWYAPSGSSFTKRDLKFESDKPFLLLKYGWNFFSLRQLYQLGKKSISEIFFSKAQHG